MALLRGCSYFLHAMRRFVRITMVIMMCTLPCKIVWADDLQLYEQQIKAGLLYNFLKYTQWPEKKTLVTVCVFGDDPFEGYLKPMVGRSVNQREITLRFIHTIEEVDTCDLLYINAKERKQWPTLQKSLVEKSVLTVSDFDGFAASGGMIEFGKKEEHVDASLNIDAITAAHLQVQDRLLKLVTVVHPPKAGGR